MSLSEFACKNVKPKDKLYRLVDGDGLYLLVSKKAARNSGNCIIVIRKRKISSPSANIRWCRFSMRERGGTT